MLQPPLLLLFLLLALSIATQSQSSPPAEHRLPDAIIIGAKKCGTRALLKFISAHPNVSAADAELHFFDRHYARGLDWYRRHMPVAEPHHALAIEKTPKYLVDARAPRRAHRMNPRLKLIVVVRNPVTRAISEFVQSQRRKRRHIDQITSDQLERMLYSNDTAATHANHRHHQRPRRIRTEWPVVRNGLYVQHVRRWLAHFPIEQFLLVNGERLISEPSAELERVQAFLGLEPLIRREHFRYDPHKGFHCIVKPLNSSHVRCLSEEKGRKHPHVAAHMLRDLTHLYAPYDRALFELIAPGQEPWWPLNDH